MRMTTDIGEIVIVYQQSRLNRIKLHKCDPIYFTVVFAEFHGKLFSEPIDDLRI